jgi:5'-nucleotidase
MAPLGATLAAEAAALRAKGATVIIAVAHAGGRCERFGGEPDADGCDPKSEMFEAARALPAGAVDVFVGGHTHAGVAHRVNGIALIESLSYGKAFGRVDLTVDPQTRRVVSARIWKPQTLCAKGEGKTCEPEAYEGAPVVADDKVARAIAPHIEQAKQKRSERIGVRLGSTIRRSYGEESALGNLFADLIRAAAVPTPTTVALMNGGGLRADLPEGDLDYGALYEAFPFDNKLAVAKLRAADLRGLLAHHFRGGGGILSISGVTVAVRCRPGQGSELSVELRGPDGRILKDADTVQLVASDFMLTGGDDFWGSVAPPKIDVKDTLVRDALVAQLAARKAVRESDVLDPKRPRLVYPGKRPVVCPPGAR